MLDAKCSTFTKGICLDPRVAWYQVWYGTKSGVYDGYVATSSAAATLTDLQAGQQYFMAVRACDTAQLECSGFSNEVSATAPFVAPIARFVATTAEIDLLSVVFKDESSGNITGRQWQFGDGNTATTNETSVAHRYAAPGTYSVRLSVYGPAGTDFLVRQHVVSAGPPVPPNEGSGGAGGSLPDNQTDSPAGYPVTEGGTASNGDYGSAEPLIEASEARVNHEWRRVEFENRFEDPVVVAKAFSANGGQPAVVRVAAVDPEGFWIRIQEWDYLDGRHADETVGYLAMERGRHRLASGAWVEADLVDVASQPADVAFASPFRQSPVLVSGTVTQRNAGATTTRVQRVGPRGFEVGLQTEEGSPPWAGVETVAFVAWEPSQGGIDGRGFSVGRSDRAVRHKPYRLVYDAAFVSAPVFLAEMQTAYGRDTANLRWRAKGTRSLEVWVDEEQSLDREVGHTTEVVGYVLIE